jgi:phage gp45-like
MRGFTDTIFKKLFLLISRGRLLQIDNSKSDVQTIQISSLANETITDIERYQEYGFENYPVISNAETITIFVNGNRNAGKGINIVVNNRGLRPTDLASGDVCIYCKDSSNSNQNRIWLKPVKNEIEIKTADNNDIVINSDGIVITDKNNNEYKMTNTGTKLTDKNNNKIETKSTGIFLTDSVNNTIAIDTNLISLKNSVSDMKKELENIWTLIASLNTNLASFVSTNCVVGAPVTPNPATLALFAADLVQANVYKAALAAFLK